MIKNFAYAGGAVALLLGSAALAQTPSGSAGATSPSNAAKTECTPSSNATAGHDQYGANTAAGRPVDSEKPECNVGVGSTTQQQNNAASSADRAGSNASTSQGSRSTGAASGTTGATTDEAGAKATSPTRPTAPSNSGAATGTTRPRQTAP